MQVAHKIAFNTGILCLRIFITSGITLISTRITLKMLGVEDFGIFSLISGIVMMLSFLSTAMTIATQRNLSFHGECQDLNKQRSVFSNSLMLHLLGGFFIVFFMEFSGLFLFDGFLNIPPDRIESSRIIFQFMIGSVLISILQTPFVASICAHEHMHLLAIVNVLEAILRLLSILFVYWMDFPDPLIWFGAFNFLNIGISLCLYAFVAFSRYSECTLHLGRFVRFGEMKKLGIFVGWNLFGSLCNAGRVQGLPVILNLFLGVVVNTAYGIANQLGSYFWLFSSIFLQAINPQIMKSEGIGNRFRMLRLCMSACKFAFFLLAIIAIPCLFEMNGLLSFWLHNVPPYAPVFCMMILIGSMIGALTFGLDSGIIAMGDVRKYQMVMGVAFLMNLPLAYFLLKQGYSAYWTLGGYIAVETLSSLLRLYFMRVKGGLSIREFFNRVLSREVIPVAMSVFTCLLISHVFDEGFFRILLTMIFSTVAFTLGVYFIGLCRDEKAAIDSLFVSAVGKIRFNLSKNIQN